MQVGRSEEEEHLACSRICKEASGMGEVGGDKILLFVYGSRFGFSC